MIERKKERRKERKKERKKVKKKERKEKYEEQMKMVVVWQEKETQGMVLIEKVNSSESQMSQMSPLGFCRWFSDGLCSSEMESREFPP